MTPRDTTAMRKAMRAVPYCRICHTPTGLQVHHVVPRSRTQSDEPANLIVLCHRHHREVHDRREDLGPHLTAAEGAHAVLLCGTVHSAHRLLYPSEHPSKVAA
ncbi:MAG: HNH endonuclease [Thermoanaerobaculia bacterium]